MNFIDNIAERFWRFFSSLKLALGLFISLVVSTMAGSIVLQRPIAEPGQLERVYSPETIRFLDFFGLLDVFHSWWFVLQLVLLALNVIVASIDMWPKFKKRIESFDLFFSDRLEGVPSLHAKLKFRGEKAALVESLSSLMRKRFRRPRVAERDGKTYLGAESGKFAHLSVYIIHAGIIIVLIGGMIGSRKGFEGQMQLSAGEKRDFYFDRKQAGKRVPLGFEVRCLGTRMERYPDGTPKAYFSDLEIVDRGEVVASKMIKVNDPLSYNGIYFYQATFGQEATDEKATFSLEIVDSKSGRKKNLTTEPQKEERLPNGKGYLKVIDYAENIPLEMEGHRKDLGEAVRIELSERGEPAMPIWLFKEFPDFDRRVRQGRYSLIFKNFNYDYKVREVTGLQVARNPGIGITWFGSTLLLSGLLATFLIPHRKLWIVVSDREILVAAASHRHPETFARKFRCITNKIAQDLEREEGGLRVAVPA